MRVLIVALGLLLVSGVVAGADTTGGGNYVDSWLNNVLPHNHEYTDNDTIYKQKARLGIGVDLTIWEFEGGLNDWGLESIEAQNKFDFNNKNYSLFGVVQLNGPKIFKKIFGMF